MDIAIVGPDPAAASAEAAFGDIDANVMPVETSQLDGFDFAVVIGTTGDDCFRQANAALDQWIAVEVGGVGGRAFEDANAAVSLFTADSACYDCLCSRVVAGTEETDVAPTGVKSAVRFAGALAGRRAIQHFSGEELGGTVVEVPGREREFFRVPGCDCHDAPEGFDRKSSANSESRTYRDVTLDDAVERMERVVDDTVGLVTEVGEQASFPVPYYVAATADTTVFSDARCAEFGAGVSEDWNAAYAKAVGEALERYCAGVYRTDALRSAPTEGVIDAVPVSAFVRPDGAVTPDSDERVLWADGVDLRTGEHAALPASFVYFPPPGETYAPPITTGLGFGNSLDEAILSGLYETIERDATMLSWYSTFEPMELAVENEAFQTLRKRARAENLTVTPLLCTQDVDVPVVAVAVHRDGEWPQFALGSAADLDAGAAAADACAEALQNWTELASMGPEMASQQEGAIGRYAEFPPEAQAFVDTEVTIPASDVGAEVAPEEEVDAVLSRLAEAEPSADAGRSAGTGSSANTGLSAYAVRTTTSDVAELGFEAVRVLVPAAQPLFTQEPYFGERVETVPESLGFEGRPDRTFHPFP
jgi:ribosomal protein S12 methylthiotransferase accessory factor